MDRIHLSALCHPQQCLLYKWLLWFPQKPAKRVKERKIVSVIHCVKTTQQKWSHNHFIWLIRPHVRIMQRVYLGSTFVSAHMFYISFNAWILKNGFSFQQAFLSNAKTGGFLQVSYKSSSMYTNQTDWQRAFKMCAHYWGLVKYVSDTDT